MAHWPVAIIQDRYSGTYSGGSWLAISEASNMLEERTRASWCLEEGPSGGDTDAMVFWMFKPDWIAVGRTPDEALAALLRGSAGRLEE